MWERCGLRKQPVFIKAITSEETAKEMGPKALLKQTSATPIQFHSLGEKIKKNPGNKHDQT